MIDLFTDAQIDAYQRNGYIILPDLFKAEEVSI